MQKETNNPGEEQPIYSYSFMQRLGIKRSNVFWHIVDLLANKIKFIANLYTKLIGDEYRKEIEKFGLKSSKKILHVGCGAFPITAMVFSEMDNAEIITIDSNVKSVKLANKIISKKKIDGKIRAEVGNGAGYPLDSFDLIVISGCSVPKIKVLKHVFQNTKPGCRIIVRESISTRDMMLKFISSYGDIELVDNMVNYPFPSSKWESFLLIKR